MAQNYNIFIKIHMYIKLNLNRLIKIIFKFVKFKY